MTTPAQLISQARNAGRTALDELAGKQLLAAYGITVPKSIIVPGAAESKGALAGFKAPFAVKVVSPDILHKSDAGGVKVNVGTVAAVEETITTMMRQPAISEARVDGFLIEEMAPAGLEIVIGGLRDDQVGPLVMVGLGGVFVEILADVAFRICPITPLDAGEMLEELKGAAIFNGARGGKPLSREAVIDALLKVGGEHGLLMGHADDIREADINPLIVSETGAIAVDARFILT